MRKGLSPFDVRHAVVASYVWELPFGAGRWTGKNWSGWMEKAFGGWQMGGILSLASGAPASISMQTRSDLDSLGLAVDSPDLIQGTSNNPVLGDPDRYFDPSGFAFPAARTIGNLGRDTLIIPGVANFDLSLSKSVSIWERVSLQVRTEVFNLLNRANLGLPATRVFDNRGRRSGNAGFVSSTNTTARQIQFGLRLVF
jgi:hypothetical protein